MLCSNAEGDTELVSASHNSTKVISMEMNDNVFVDNAMQPNCYLLRYSEII